MSKSPSRRESNTSNSGSHSNGPLFDFTEDEILSLPLPDLIRKMEHRGLTPEQTAIINRRRQLLRNRQHATTRRESLPTVEYVEYISSEEVIQPQPLISPSGSQNLSSIDSKVTNEDDNTVTKKG